MRVGEVARRTGLSVRTIRYYEERDYLPRRTRTTGGHRIYGNADVQWLQSLQILRATGVTPSLAARALNGQLSTAEHSRVDRRLAEMGSRIQGTRLRLGPGGNGTEAPVEGRISLSFDVFLLRERIATLLGTALRPTGMASADYAVLSLVWYEKLTPAALTRLVGVAPSTLARRLTVLVERGWIARWPNPDRAGSWMLEITATGREQVRRGLPLAEQVFTELDAALRRAGIEPDLLRTELQTASEAVRSLLPDS